MSVPRGVKLPYLAQVWSGYAIMGTASASPPSQGMFFDPSYTGNCLVNVGCIGFLRKDKLLNNAVSIGDVLPGRRPHQPDGIHGVTRPRSNRAPGTVGGSSAGRPHNQETRSTRASGSTRGLVSSIETSAGAACHAW